MTAMALPGQRRVLAEAVVELGQERWLGQRLAGGRVAVSVWEDEWVPFALERWDADPRAYAEASELPPRVALALHRRLAKAPPGGCDSPPVFVSAAAGLAWKAGRASQCLGGRRGRRAARVARIARRDLCGADPGTLGCIELGEARASGCAPTCEDAKRLPCDRRVSKTQVRAWRSGDERLPPLGPYETWRPHHAGGKSPCCHYSHATQARLRLHERVSARMQGARWSEVAEAIRRAEKRHRYGKVWQRCDADVRSLVERAAGARPTAHYERLVYELRRAKKHMQDEGYITPATALAVGLDPADADSPQAIEDALRQAERELASVRGRRRRR